MQPSSSSSSRASSQRSGSIHRSLFARIPKGFALVELQSDTNSTMTGIQGPGRIVGTMLSSAGRAFERAIDRFSEEQLGLGPNKAALRLVSVLHDIHVDARFGRCTSDYGDSSNQSMHITDRLIWVCNGFCSQCYAAYLPQVLVDFPEIGRKAFSQLMRYLHAAQPISNIALAAVYIRLVVESQVLAAPLLGELGLADALSNTKDSLISEASFNDSVTDVQYALNFALVAVQKQLSSSTELNSLTRFEIDNSPSTRVAEVLEDLLHQIRNTDDWSIRECRYAQLLTCLSVIVIHDTSYKDVFPVENIVKFISSASTQGGRNMPSYLTERSNSVRHRVAAIFVASNALIFNGHGDTVRSVQFSPSGRQLASGSHDKTLRLWSRSGAQISQLPGHTGWITSVAFSPDGSHLASGSASLEQSIRVWNMDAQSVKAILRGHRATVRTVAFSSDGSYIASGSADKTIRLWDAKAGQETHVLVGHIGEVNSVACSPMTPSLVSGSDDGTVRWWDTRTRNSSSAFRGHSGPVSSVDISRDGLRVVTSSNDKSIRLWDVRTARQITLFNGHTNWVTSVAFSPEGTRVVSGSLDTTVRLWQVESTDPGAILRGHTGPVCSVAFSPDGERIASGSNDDTIRVWDVTLLRTSDLASAPVT